MATGRGLTVQVGMLLMLDVQWYVESVLCWDRMRRLPLTDYTIKCAWMYDRLRTTVVPIRTRTKTLVHYRWRARCKLREDMQRMIVS